jgi:hypothetical protein
MAKMVPDGWRLLHPDGTLESAPRRAMPACPGGEPMPLGADGSQEEQDEWGRELWPPEPPTG